MKTKKTLYPFNLLLILLLSVTLITCDNSTGDDHDHEEEPIGLRVKQGTTVVVEQNLTNVTGTISLTAQNTSSFTVVFISEDGDEFTPEVEEHSIEVIPAAAFVTAANVNSDSAPFSFDLTASEAGTTSITIRMLHEGAAEFVSLALPVQVSSAP